MERRLEREVMDDEAQALAYARADFSVSNRFFVDAVVRAAAGPLWSALDIGCGPGAVTVGLARALRQVTVIAVDASRPMLALAAAAVRAAGLARRIALVEGRLPALPLRAAAVDLIVSKDLLHHLPDPGALWAQVVRLGAPGARVCVMDLVRPDSPDAARRIVDRVAGEADPILQEDFYNSLCAAFTPDDVRSQLAAAGLDFEVRPAGERHLLVSGRLPG